MNWSARTVITPGERERVRGFHFRGEGSVQRLLTGWLADFPQSVASRVPASWNQVAEWLRLLDGLSRAA